MFENFPYTNYHNLNLDWIIEKVKEAYGPDNPPPTFVMSVDGQTGDVIVYPDAVVKLPTVDESTWNIFRFANGTERGVEFSPGEMKRIDGTGRYKIYDAKNPPPYPVESVNGKKGVVTTPFVNPSESILDLDTDSPGDTWGFARNTPGGKATLYLDTTGNNIKAYIQYVSNDETIYKEYPLLTNEDIPASAGVVSVNGEYGVVTVYGSGISRSSTNAQTIDAALTALENNVSNNSDAITELTNITDTLAIVANGDTHPQIANGQFVIVKNHSTLPDGVYKATAAIQTDGALSTRNLQADGAGGLNNLQSQVDSLNSNINKWGPFDGTSKVWVSSGDLNNYKTPGVYAISTGVTNIPGNIAWGILEVLAVRQDTIEQKYYYRTQIFVRELRDGIWSTWEELALNSKITNVLKSGQNIIGNIILPGYNTGSGNYFDFFVPCSTGGKTVTSASLADVTAIYLPTTVANFSSAPGVTVIEQTDYGVRLELRYPSTNTPNVCGTIYAIELKLTCS